MYHGAVWASMSKGENRPFSWWRKGQGNNRPPRVVRGPSDEDEAKRRLEAASTPLSAMVQHLGRHLDTWLDVAWRPLPETCRLSAHRNDKAWTQQQVMALGATPLPWMHHQQAFTMPFERGKAPEGTPQRMMSLLHETGRITRQEAASMLPVCAMDLHQNMKVLDLCAAPGSKTTQLAEALHPNGVVVANDPVSGRVNMLVSNRSRIGLANVVVTQHDGRHFARLPPPGFDAVLADVPCTGTATTRKNRDVWWQWSPKEGRKMFNMQHAIAARGASLLKPGGFMVYSTCSIDPIENEAVVAQLLRTCPYLELVEVSFEGFITHPGMQHWHQYDDDGHAVAYADADRLPFASTSHWPPGERMNLEDADQPAEVAIHEALVRCCRVWHDDNDTGGFFIAKFQHRPEAAPDGLAQTYRSGRAKRASQDWTPTMKAPPTPSENSVVLADEATVNSVGELYGFDSSGYSMWQRGKRLNIAPPMVKERLYDPPSPTNKGDIWGGSSFHPIRVVHAGLPAFTLKKDSWRSRQESLYAFADAFSGNLLDITPDTFTRLLTGWAPMVEAFMEHTQAESLPSGAMLLRSAMPWGPAWLSVWIGARVTLMIDRNEQNVLRYKLGLPWREEEEDE